MNQTIVEEKPSLQIQGIRRISDRGGDQVSIFIAVPCNEKGKVDTDTQDVYVELAEQKFHDVRPDTEPA